MENPATWGKAERVVDATISNWGTFSEPARVTAGLSLARMVCDALREAGLLVPEEK